jgi:hypothetical protein
MWQRKMAGRQRNETIVSNDVANDVDQLLVHRIHLSGYQLYSYRGYGVVWHIE